MPGQFFALCIQKDLRGERFNTELLHVWLSCVGENINEDDFYLFLRRFFQFLS